MKIEQETLTSMLWAVGVISFTVGIFIGFLL